MPITPKKLEKKLLKNGFVDTGNGKGSHRVYKNYKTGRTTTIPFSKKEIGSVLEKKIYKQAGI